MKPERWRLFVAVPIGDELRRDLAAAVDEWKKRPDLAGLRWIDAESWHVTLAFLGSVERERATDVARIVGAVSSAHVGFVLATGGVGGFPSAARARVAWYGVRDDAHRLRSIGQDLYRRLGLDPSPFLAHITLARTRREPVDLRPWRAEASMRGHRLVVDRLDLMRSHLGRGPATYEVLASLAIGSAAHRPRKTGAAGAR